MTSQAPPPRRSFGRRALGFALRGLVPMMLALVAAVALFQFVVMPRFVRHGRDVEIPDLTGTELRDAGVVLARMNLVVRDTLDRSDSEAPVGTVIDQIPRPGRRIKPERGVQLIVSRGLEARTVPRLSGQTLRFARLTLSQDGYVLGNVVRVPSEDVPRNFVISSDPPEGRRIAQGTRVSLLVSDGPEEEAWIMPDLRGRELDVTADRLKRYGFAVDVIQSGTWMFRSRRVGRTIPVPGAQVAEGDTIRLYGD